MAIRKIVMTTIIALAPTAITLVQTGTAAGFIIKKQVATMSINFQNMIFLPSSILSE